MPRGVFDIYQTNSGYTAVDNPVRRQILEALEQGDKELPELVEITGKSKPTLSATHMKALINSELVAEEPHPTDGRRKVYRLIAHRIGSSDIPVPQLRKAVEAYVSLAPLQGRLPLLDVLDVVVAAPADAPPHVLMAQGERLGAASASGLRVPDLHTLWIRLLQWFEQQGIGRAARVDVEAGEVEIVLGGRLAERPVQAAAALAGLVQGIAAALQLEGAGPVAGVADGARVILRQTV